MPSSWVVLPDGVAPIPVNRMTGTTESICPQSSNAGGIKFLLACKDVT